MKYAKKIFSIFGLILAGDTFAQQKAIVADTTIKATTIEITQIYKPQIKQTKKQDYNPSLPPTDNSPSSFQYQVPQYQQDYSYKPMPLQALAIAKDTNRRSYDHYIKAALGNLRTIYLDAGLSDLKTKGSNTKIHLGLLSQKGDIKYQQQTVAVLNTLTQTNSQKYEYSLGLDAAHHNFFQYGYDHIAFPTAIANNQSLTGATISLGLSEKVMDANKFKKNSNLGFSYYSGSDILGESGVSGSFTLQKSLLDSLTAEAGILGNIAFFQANNYSANNGYLSFKLGGAYHHNNLVLRAYALPTIAQNQAQYLLADLSVIYKIPKAKASLATGYHSSIYQNTYQQLYLFNPFLSNYTAKQTKSSEIFAELQKSFGHHLHISLRLSNWQYNNFATFLNDPLNSPEKLLVQYLPTVNAFSTLLAMRYQMGKALSVGGSMSITNYSNIPTNTKVWHSPTTRINGDLSWQVIPELSLSAYSALVAGNYAMDTKLNPILLPSYVDMGFGAEYLPLPRLSFFAQFNNLLNNKYQRWQGYQAYGINIYGGVRLKF